MVQGKIPLKKILYISYDGMTDPLGQSQVLPYLIGLSKQGYQFTLLSFEKKQRYKKFRKLIEDIVEDANIDWIPMSFTIKPPVLSKFYDAIRMRRKAFTLFKQRKFDMIHCRSYIAADIGLSLKKKFGVKFFFDMRGFWADEKRDGGAWKDENFIFNRVYKYYKRKEAQYLQHADHIISLTHTGKAELVTWASYNPEVPVSVIPCCADIDHFYVTDKFQKKESRTQLGLPLDSLIFSYLGSVGAWYMLDEMLEFFKEARNHYPAAHFLFITHSEPKKIMNRAKYFNIPEEVVTIKEANRQQVPAFIKASDINISFIKPVYSKISSSPTKLGEVLSMGIPVVVNSGVGDVESIVNNNDCGIVIDGFTKEAYRQAIRQIPSFLKKDPMKIRQSILSIFDLQQGIALYCKAYNDVFNKF